jgi:hypothetical protein
MRKASGMEAKNAGGVYRLFVIMFFFAASIFFLNSQKRKHSTATHIDALSASSHTTTAFSLDQAYHYIASLLTSHNTDLIVKVINQSMNHCAVDLVEKIIVDKRFLLSDVEKMKIIFGAVMHCNGKKSVQYNLLDFLLTYPDLCSANSALLTLMRSNYAESLPVFLSWLRERQKDGGNADLWGQFVDHAFVAAVDQNDHDVVESMLSKKIRISQGKASQLLWYVVENNRNSHFVPLLVRHGQADINYIDQGKTLLIEAVEQNNKEMIQALLDEGAVVDRVVDPQKGSALQISIARNDTVVQELLREYGA